MVGNHYLKLIQVQSDCGRLAVRFGLVTFFVCVCEDNIGATS